MKTSWSVTVVYEDEARRAQAMEFCDQLVQRFWAGGELDLSWWSYVQLRGTGSPEEAARKAAEADVIVFATHSESELPLEVTSWIEHWVAGRGDREGMLVGLVEPGASAGASGKHLHLRKIAHRGGMDYLTGLPEYVAHHIQDSAESYHERACCVTSVLDGILHHAPSPPQFRP